MTRDWEGQINEVVEMTVAKVKRDLKQNGKVDMMRWWEFVTADIMGIIAFGESFRMVETGKVGISYRGTDRAESHAEGTFVGRFGRTLPHDQSTSRAAMDTLGDTVHMNPLFKELPGIIPRFVEYGRKAHTRHGG